MTLIETANIGTFLAAGVAMTAVIATYLNGRAFRHHTAKRLAAALSLGRATVIRASEKQFLSLLDQACERLSALHHRADQRHPITGLATRESLLSMLASKPVGARRLGIVALADFESLAAFDADAADQVLSEIAQRLERLLPAHRMLAHVDRASFAILFEAVDAGQVAQELSALCYALRDRVQMLDREFLPQIRYGHVCAIGAAAKPAGVLARALNSARASVAYPSLGPAHDETSIFALEQDLRQAVQKHQLELWYQPVVNAHSGVICSVEALVRWRHPVRGLVPPGQFIPVMENTGLSEEIGNWVLDRAARDAAAWTRAGLSRVKVAVNLSAHQLGRADLDSVVERLIARHGLPPEMLELELTETAAAGDPEATRSLFAKLRARGVTIVIDDFGAGYASLSYLKRLQFDKLKIDREFVTNVDTDRQGQAICQSIIALARGLGMVVLGEGVERREEYDWLRAQGCNLFQGYYFSKPLTYDALMSFVAEPDSVLEKCASHDVLRSLRHGVLAA